MHFVGSLQLGFQWCCLLPLKQCNCVGPLRCGGPLLATTFTTLGVGCMAPKWFFDWGSRNNKPPHVCTGFIPRFKDMIRWPGVWCVMVCMCPVMDSASPGLCPELPGIGSYAQNERQNDVLEKASRFSREIFMANCYGAPVVMSPMVCLRETPTEPSNGALAKLQVKNKLKKDVLIWLACLFWLVVNFI